MKPRALFITMGPPFPPHIGGHQRTDLILRALADTHEVDALILNREETVEPAAREHLARLCSRVVYRQPKLFHHFLPWALLRPILFRFARSLAYRLGSPLNWLKVDPDVRDLIAQLHAERRYNVTVSRYLFKAFRSGVNALPNVRHVLDADDVESTVIRSQLHELPRSLSRLPRRLLLSRHLRHVDAALPRLYRSYAHVFVCSEADRALVATIRGESSPVPTISVLPNIPWTPPGAHVSPLPETPDSASIVVVGTWGWPPNYQGLNRFLSNAWPTIRQARPDATLRIVGSGMSDALRARLRALANLGVEPVGFVDAVADAYRPAALAVAPVYTGGGTKLKVAEAAAHGRVCVCTDHAYRGYENILLEDQHVLVGRDDQALAQHCIALLNDPARRAAMSADAAQRTAETLSWSAFARTVHAGCAPAAPSSSPRPLQHSTIGANA